MARYAAALRVDIEADCWELETRMGRLQVAMSQTRVAAAWLAEKGTELQLRLDDRAGGALRLLDVFETVSVGIEGKRLPWPALAAAEGRPELRETDYARLEQRAEDQRRRVEGERLEAAKAALGGLPHGSWCLRLTGLLGFAAFLPPLTESVCRRHSRFISKSK